MSVLSQQRDLLTSIQQPADGENGIIFTHIGVEKNRIAPVINNRLVSCPCVAVTNGVPHPD